MLLKVSCKPRLPLAGWFPWALCDLCPLKLPWDFYHHGHLEFPLCVCAGNPVRPSRVRLESYLCFFVPIALSPTQGAQKIRVELEPRWGLPVERMVWILSPGGNNFPCLFQRHWECWVRREYIRRSDKEWQFTSVFVSPLPMCVFWEFIR